MKELQSHTEEILAEADEFLSATRNITHDKVLREILNELKPIDFRKHASLKEKDKISQKHHVVLVIAEILRVAKKLHCGLCKHQDFFYTFNGQFWKPLDRDPLTTFLGEAASKLGIDKISASYHKFKDELYRQFIAEGYLPRPEPTIDKTIINVRNGTFEISKKAVKLRPFNRADFLTYQLSFAFDSAAQCPKWLAFLDEVLPETDERGNIVDKGKSRQRVLAEYIAYVFVTHLKLEKTLILYGTGANGKSVVFDIINSLLGKENVSNLSLDSLSDQHYRAGLANKLLNYSSEISNRLQAEKFKQLTSGEPVEARLPYGQPMTLTNYAKLAFNSNELPRDVEHTTAFFRRFLIIPFDVTIPENKRNPNLAKEIIENELSGVFNWILEGLKRLIRQSNFSPCEPVQKALETYRKESDSVAMFLEEEKYRSSQSIKMSVKEIFSAYKNYCIENGYRSLGRNNFAKRLEANGIARFDSFQPFFWIEKF